MGIGITPDHDELRRAAAAVLADVCPPGVLRSALDSDVEKLPEYWSTLADLGWFGLAVAEADGGAGLGLVEVCVVVEELGRACAPGPVLPTMVAAMVAARAGLPELPGLLDGRVVAGVTGAPGLVVSGGSADLGFLVEGDDVVVVRGGGWRAVESLDATRRLAESSGPAAGTTLAGRAPELSDLLTLLLAAEACGITTWCLDTAVEHGRQRVQFGRPIGQFQAVKHRCADLLVGLEQARAAVWDAARAVEGGDPDQTELALAVAVSLAVEHAVTAAKACVQILGGIGYTWEHSAHIYLKRALSVRALLGGGSQGSGSRGSGSRTRIAELAAGGTRRVLDLALPEAAVGIRAVIDAELEAYQDLDDDGRAEWLVGGGWIAPHWPRPFGRDAGAVEQVVIDQALRAARIRRPHLAVGAWALPTIIAHGSAEQRERYVLPTLRRDITWCQMFSEPGAGSDLAALSTRADRVEGGWAVTGQKVWTSLAAESTHAILLARTAPAGHDDRRSGISYFVLDMATPGIDVRPLRELTGQALFNEVFLDQVFVPDDCLVGDVGDGWRLARTTLANERVSMSSGPTFGYGVESLLKAAAGHEEPGLSAVLGGLVAEAQSLSLLRARSTLRALGGGQPGAESSVSKLLGAEHDQRVQELGLELLGAAGATVEGAAAQWSYGFLATRCLTIAGGTSEVQRNVIAERLLGLPRDPEPG